MPTIAELLKAEGVEITPELEAKLPTLTEASDEVRGLVSTKDDLLKWKEINTEKITGYDAIREAQEADLNEREKLAKENDDYKTQLEIRDEREKRLNDTLTLRNEQAVTGSRESMTSDVASLFNCSKTGASLAQNMVNVSIGEDGQIVKSFNLEGETYGDFDSLKQAALKVDWLAAQMKGPDAKGPDAKGSQGSSYKGKSFKEMSQSERLQFKQSDPLGFSQAIRGN